MTTEGRLKKIALMEYVTAEQKVVAFLRILVGEEDDNRVLVDVQRRSHDAFCAMMEADMAAEGDPQPPTHDLGGEA
jgi:lysylphosphatidylglycerol synthetase-like protein (DUF2156 family)